MEVPQIIPKNKTFYIGGRKFIEGDIIPSALLPKVKVIVTRDIDKKEKRQYRTRRGSISNVEEIQ